MSWHDLLMATIQEQLTEAQDALHNLLIGKAVRVYVDQNGERIEYTQATRGALVAYISDLKQQLGAKGHGPMYLVL